ncbi:MAG: AmmeMemoRadiSam system radical SAM enzyme [Ignisphaera sp.]
MPKEAMLYRVIDSSKKIVECTACPRRCKLRDGQYGFCGIRWNFDGKLYLASHGLAIAVAIDPIEKKPLYHFNPGSMVFSLSTTGCSWACSFCQNWDISQRRVIAGWRLPPELAVELALSYGAQGITYTYNEPVVFIEYAYDIGILAKKQGLFNTMVTNGYMTDNTIDLVSRFIDATTVDLKGNGDKEFARKFSLVPDIESVFNAMAELKRKGVFIEVTDLVVPKYGDNIEMAKKLARWIVENLGPETPVHFLRFHPDYKLLDVPSTPLTTLERHAQVAKDEGLKYIYLGNVPGHKLESTYCPNCGRMLIRRFGFDILEVNLTQDMRCPFCGYKINVTGKVHPTYKLDRFVYIPLENFTEFVHVKHDQVRKFVLENASK